MEQELDARFSYLDQPVQNPASMKHFVECSQTNGGGCSKAPLATQANALAYNLHMALKKSGKRLPCACLFFVAGAVEQGWHCFLIRRVGGDVQFAFMLRLCDDGCRTLEEAAKPAIATHIIFRDLLMGSASKLDPPVHPTTIDEVVCEIFDYANGRSLLASFSILLGDVAHRGTLSSRRKEVVKRKKVVEDDTTLLLPFGIGAVEVQPSFGKKVMSAIGAKTMVLKASRTSCRTKI